MYMHLSCVYECMCSKSQHKVFFFLTLGSYSRKTLKVTKLDNLVVVMLLKKRHSLTLQQRK